MTQPSECQRTSEPDRGTIFPEGISAVIEDMIWAYNKYKTKRDHDTCYWLVVKWDRLRDALLNYEARSDE